MGSAADDPGGGSGPGSGSPNKKRRTRYTARAAVLLLVFCALALTLAYPVQQYVAQSAKVERLRQQNAERQTELARLQQQLQDWQDSAFVEIQARKRLHYVKPGEIGLRLLGQTDAAGAAGAVTLPGMPGTAWYSQLWGSVTAAANPDQGTDPSPVPSAGGR